MTPQEQTYLRIFKIVEEDPQISQRQLALRIGVSVGKANSLIKVLVDAGQIRINSFRQPEHNFKCAYLLTPKGMRARIRLTRVYLRRIKAEYDALIAEVEAFDRRGPGKTAKEASR